MFWTGYCDDGRRQKFFIFSVPPSIRVGSDSTWVPLFLRGPQRKPSITSSGSITSDSQFVSTSLSHAISFREATRNHILMSFHDRIRRTIKTSPFKQSHIIIVPLGKKEQREKIFFSNSVSEHKSCANSIGAVVLDVIKLKDVAGFVGSVCKS